MSIRVKDPDKKVYIVLGMHQSGTSLLAKALSDQGIKMGNKPGGFYENQGAIYLNNQMLGGNWAYPKPVDQNFSKKIQNFINKYESDMWGFKDPRTSLTVDKYLPFLEDDDVYLIAVFRKPSRVVKSLKRIKHKTKIDDYKKVIDRYNKSILESVKKFVEL